MAEELIIKVSHPAKNTGFHDLGILAWSPGCRGCWGNYRFEINNDVSICDYWLIFESTPEKERVHVPRGNVIFVPGEEVMIRSYSADYLEQFDAIITSRSDINGEHVIKSHFMPGWFVKRTYDELKSQESISKDKTLSIIVSTENRLAGKRLDFAYQMINYFGDRMDAFGKGINYVEDKYDALSPYKYSIAIENGVSDDYWTEKIADCYVSHTMPIYYGCPNITDYFSADSFIPIDIYDSESSIRAIEDAIGGDAYQDSLPAILDAKNKMLDELQFFPWLTGILDANERLFSITSSIQEVELVPISQYECPRWT